MGMPGVFAWGIVRHLVAGLSDVHGGDAQRHQPAVRDVRQRRQRRHRRADAHAGRHLAHLVPAEPGAARVRWSLRNNNNYEQTGLLVSLNYFANNRIYFLRNFYDKSKRSILKPKVEGPAAYVLPGQRSAPRRAGRAAARAAEAGGRDLARDRGVHRDDPGRRAGGRPRWSRRRPRRRGGRCDRQAPARRRPADRRSAGGTEQRRRRRRRAPPRRRASSRRAATSSAWISRTRASRTRCSTISTGRPTIAQARPYDDTGWTFPEGVRRAGRPRHRREGARRADGTGEGGRQSAERRLGRRQRLRDQPQRRQRARSRSATS